MGDELRWLAHKRERERAAREQQQYEREADIRRRAAERAANEADDARDRASEDLWDGEDVGA